MNKEFDNTVEKKLHTRSTYNKFITIYKYLEALM